jgi:prolyl-tRNA synthetase
VNILSQSAAAGKALLPPAAMGKMRVFRLFAQTMRASQFHVATLKEAPADAEVVSHQLMIRAGMIRKLAGGIYSYMPMGLRVIRKIEAIIREEMNRAGAVELLMPVVQPAELWQETGRWDKMGPEMMRVKDRHDRDFIIQPTSEEVITDIARNEIQSYRQLPKNFYHIQTKFRDERRPRFGVMRGREFTMKDAYSFDRDEAAAEKSYQAMYQAYVRTFERMGLSFRAVRADTGNIGGSLSHEFQVIADTGEDQLVYCPDSDYAANIELAEALPLAAALPAPTETLRKVATPDTVRCEDVAKLLGLPIERTVKSVVLAVDTPLGAEVWLLLVRGDHELNEIKAGKVPGLDAGFRFASEQEIIDHFGCVPGYLGPLNTKKPVKIVADRTVAHMADFVSGANEAGFHIAGINWGRDLPEPEIVADIRNVVAGDPSPDGKGLLAIQRGIEVGHVFFLGTKYSEAMNATYLDETGKPKLMVMGCYGIGVTRLVGAAIEQGHDAKGIIFPAAIAPFQVVIVPMNYAKSEAVRKAAGDLLDELLKAGIDAILDDRDERAGSMFADWELIGVPHRVVVGERGLKEGKLEYKGRADAEASDDPRRGDAGLPEARAARLIARLVLAVCRGAAAAGGAGRRPAVRTAGGQRAGQPAAAIADRASPEPQFPSIQEKVDWLTEMSARLSRRIPDREARLDLLKTVYYEAKRAGLDPQMVLGLIQVESGFKKYAVSSAGARGYMQVMPFWIRLIGK